MIGAVDKVYIFQKQTFFWLKEFPFHADKMGAIEV